MPTYSNKENPPLIGICKINRFSGIVFSILFSTVSYAGVYQCVGANGLVEFRDRPCEQGEAQSFLAYTYEPSDSLKTAESIQTASDFNAENSSIDKLSTRKDLEVALAKDKQRQREERLAKKAVKEAEKFKRQQARCHKTEDKIKAIEEELNKGCKHKRQQRLQKELLHLTKMRERYCSAPPK